MSRKEIMAKLAEILSSFIDVEGITEESEIVADLEISSMEVLTLVCNMESEFDIEIPEKVLRKMVTVGDVVDAIAERI